jgi:hypothetical protein
VYGTSRNAINFDLHVAVYNHIYRMNSTGGAGRQHDSLMHMAVVSSTWGRGTASPSGALAGSCRRTGEHEDVRDRGQSLCP